MNLVLALLLTLAGTVPVSLSWNASPTKGVTYYLYRAKGSCSGQFVRQATTRNLSWSGTQPAGNTYCYYVTAFKGTDSVPSNTVLVK